MGQGGEALHFTIGDTTSAYTAVGVHIGVVHIESTLFSSYLFFFSFFLPLLLLFSFGFPLCKGGFFYFT